MRNHHDIPSKKILTNYATVLTDFALGKGKGLQKNEVVLLEFDLVAYPLVKELYKRIILKGANALFHMRSEDFEKTLLTYGSDNQITFLPKSYLKSLVKTIDHRIVLIGNNDPFYLRSIAYKKIIKSRQSLLWYKKLIFQKEDQKKLTWTIALWGTEGMAKEAGISYEDYWDEIIKACFLLENDPVQKWRSVLDEISQITKKLNALPIKKLHIVAKDTDLWITLGEKRRFLRTEGSNIPSFEIYTSPDWRGTEGHVFFNHPLYYQGNVIRNIHLKFCKGKVQKGSAQNNNQLFQELIKQCNSDKIGEFSLTDRRFSKIDAFMAYTLYDENYGGLFGNLHIALGASFHEAYTGNCLTMKKKDWRLLGFNDAMEHVDIITTSDRIVEALLFDGTKKVIYKNGIFTL